jgi:polyphosphate kinase
MLRPDFMRVRRRRGQTRSAVRGAASPKRRSTLAVRVRQTPLAALPRPAATAPPRGRSAIAGFVTGLSGDRPYIPGPSAGPEPDCLGQHAGSGATPRTDMTAPASTKHPEFAPEHFFNRELSWLEFNQRVLDEALNPKTPLFERLKFFCIVSSNLDEFFEVRVAGLKQQIESDVVERSVDGRTSTETFRAVVKRVRQMVGQQYACWHQELLPALEKSGIRFLDPAQLAEGDRRHLRDYFRSEALPVLSPLAIDPAHPFPQLLNKSLNLIVQLEMRKGRELLRHLAVVQVPRVLPRLVQLPREDGRRDYVLLGRLIGHHLIDLFPGTRILGYWPFRVTRNSELYIDEEEIANLLKAVERELHNRRKGDAVRLEVETGCPEDLCRALLGTLRLTADDLYVLDWPLNPTRLMSIYEGDHSPELRDPPFVAPVAESVRGQPDLFAAIRERDILLHHPYDSFETVVELLQKAADDPNVLAIKQTLYRTGGDARMIGALMRAVENGKQVAAVVELRARFDEANNIEWSKKLEANGVHVVYGLVGYKIHAKMTLIVRRDPDGIRRYLHLGTGNYNPATAKVYTDLGLLTCRPDLGEDVTTLFNLLTGICQFQDTHKLIVSPFQLHRRMLELIERERRHAQQGLPCRIIAKMNSLVDPEIIRALYRASQAGVPIQLIVRGICCLRPGVPGVSENIQVRSLVGRFLEHSRVFYFENACQPEVFLGSADWMPRNFFRRIESVFPVENGVLRDWLLRDYLESQLADNVSARLMNPDGSYTLAEPSPGAAPRHSQVEFITQAAEQSRAWRPKGRPKARYLSMDLRPSPFVSAPASGPVPGAGVNPKPHPRGRRRPI